MANTDSVDSTATENSAETNRVASSGFTILSDGSTATSSDYRLVTFNHSGGLGDFVNIERTARAKPVRLTLPFK